MDTDITRSNGAAELQNNEHSNVDESRQNDLFRTSEKAVDLKSNPSSVDTDNFISSTISEGKQDDDEAVASFEQSRVNSINADEIHSPANNEIMERASIEPPDTAISEPNMPVQDSTHQDDLSPTTTSASVPMTTHESINMDTTETNNEVGHSTEALSLSEAEPELDNNAASEATQSYTDPTMPDVESEFPSHSYSVTHVTENPYEDLQENENISNSNFPEVNDENHFVPHPSFHATDLSYPLGETLSPKSPVQQDTEGALETIDTGLDPPDDQYSNAEVEMRTYEEFDPNLDSQHFTEYDVFHEDELSGVQLPYETMHASHHGSRPSDDYYGPDLEAPNPMANEMIPEAFHHQDHYHDHAHYPPLVSPMPNFNTASSSSNNMPYYMNHSTRGSPISSTSKSPTGIPRHDKRMFEMGPEPQFGPYPMDADPYVMSMPMSDAPVNYDPPSPNPENTDPDFHRGEVIIPYAPWSESAEGNTIRGVQSNRGRKLDPQARYTRMGLSGAWPRFESPGLPLSILGTEDRSELGPNSILTALPIQSRTHPRVAEHDRFQVSATFRMHAPAPPGPAVAELPLPPSTPVDMLLHPTIRSSLGPQNDLFMSLRVHAISMIEQDNSFMSSLTRLCAFLRGEGLESLNWPDPDGSPSPNTGLSTPGETLADPSELRSETSAHDTSATSNKRSLPEDADSVTLKRQKSDNVAAAEIGQTSSNDKDAASGESLTNEIQVDLDSNKVHEAVASTDDDPKPTDMNKDRLQTLREVDDLGPIASASAAAAVAAKRQDPSLEDVLDNGSYLDDALRYSIVPDLPITQLFTQRTPVTLNSAGVLNEEQQSVFASDCLADLQVFLCTYQVFRSRLQEMRADIDSIERRRRGLWRLVRMLASDWLDEHDGIAASQE